MNQTHPEILSPEQKFQRKLFIVRIALSQGTQAACLRSGTAERTIRSWKRGFLKHGLKGLKEKSRKPYYSPGRKDQGGAMAQALIDIFDQNPGLTNLQIFAKLLAVKTTEIPSMSWLTRTKRRLGLNRKRRVKTQEHKTRYSASKRRLPLEPPS